MQLLILLALVVVTVAVKYTSPRHGDTVGTLKDQETTGICDNDVKQLSGYFNVKSGVDKNYFFWFFEARNNAKTAPLTVWLTGGPGCSSQLALMTENGPCTPTPDGQNTVNNPYSWNTDSNIMWVDQPAKVGYSYSSSIEDYDHNEEEVGTDLYNFLLAFFEAHPEYKENDFYVFGESFGGHFVPAITKKIYDGNLAGNSKINLVGLGIGNGLTDPVIQYQYYAEMANHNTYGVKAVSDEQEEKMKKAIPRCAKLAEACQTDDDKCQSAYEYCNIEETTPYYASGLNPYDIRKECGDSSLCYNMTSTETFLNLESTKTALGVSSEVKEWVECNNKVNGMFANDWMHNFDENLIPMLESNIRVLIYAGDCDFICNWMGNKAWTLALEWTGQKDFNSADDKEIGYGVVRKAVAAEGTGSLTFLQVYEAGHMVPMDQPKNALSLFNTFIQDKSYTN
jgi:cathepsin A (carboxypeptidase C)